jgi:hypothetical protein
VKINEILVEAKATSQRLDPKCWKGKKIGNPKTKVKGGVRVNNCVPVKESESHEPVSAMSNKDLALYLGTSEETVAKNRAAAEEAANEKSQDYAQEQIEETYEGDEFYEAYGEMWYNEDEQLDEAEYHGRKVPLGKPMRGDVKKFKVYVKDPSTGNVKKVNFGDPNMRIKKSNPARRKSFRARHNCANPGPRTKARYWSCRKW